MDFNITSEEQNLLFVIVDHLDAGNAPGIGELSTDMGHDAYSAAQSLRKKGWVAIRNVDGRDTIVALATPAPPRRSAPSPHGRGRRRPRGHGCGRSGAAAGDAVR
ncbi:hypothetical protein GCM10010315_36820 [Streptomyces luteosporeus]|uniref:MarR family transcriptional regulator n=1 Tax=Streptomyces luteosporeus TaxID=173856 RepID=A0ABN3TUB1_9ACTN